MVRNSNRESDVTNGGLASWSRRNVVKATGAGVTLSLLSGIGSASSGEGDDEGVEELGLVGEVAVENASILDVQGNYTYVSTWSGIVVIDSHDPVHPEAVAEVDVPGVGVHENYLRVDCDLLGVTSQGNGLAPLLGIDEEDLERVDEDELGVQFYDVSDPTSPEHLGTWQEPPVGVHSFALDGDYAYLATGAFTDDSALRIIDISDPTNPTDVAEWRVEDEHPEFDQPVNFLHGVHVQDDFAYLAYWDAGTRILDVSAPSDPVEVSAFGEAPDATEPGEGGAASILEDPESEFTRRYWGLPGNAHASVPSSDGDYVYVSEETLVGPPGRILVFDVTDFDDPVQVTRIDPPGEQTSEYAHYFEVTPDRIHSSWEEGGVRVFDISDPENPEELARYDPEGFHSENSEARNSFTISTFGGAGVVFLHPDLGEHRPPAFDHHEDDEH